ncbi:MAG: hypothetical protein HQK49_11695 [Oligoflexia bacterium]|nr:hypothetical protein [Oligoflexia bacterium]
MCKISQCFASKMKLNLQLVLNSNNTSFTLATKSIEQTSSVWAHEYAHNLFENEIRQQFGEEITNILKAHLSKYHELFADLIPVLWSNKGDVISTLLTTDDDMIKNLDHKKFAEDSWKEIEDTIAKKNKNIQKRNFLIEHTVPAYPDRGDMNGLVNYIDGNYSEPHQALSPTRSFIGKLLPSIKTENDKKQLIKTVKDAIIQEVQEEALILQKMQSGDTSDSLSEKYLQVIEKQEDIKRCNDDLIKRIKQSLLK